jgi:hypothetical protein
MVAKTPTILIGFHQFLQANVGILPGLGLDHFLLNPFQFVIHSSSYHSMLHNLDGHKIIHTTQVSKEQTMWEDNKKK